MASFVFSKLLGASVLCLVGVAFIVLYLLLLIAIGKMEILTTFPLLQDEIWVSDDMKVGIAQNYSHMLS